MWELALRARGTHKCIAHANLLSDLVVSHHLQTHIFNLTLWSGSKVVLGTCYSTWLAEQQIIYAA